MTYFYSSKQISRYAFSSTGSTSFKDSPISGPSCNRNTSRPSHQEVVKNLDSLFSNLLAPSSRQVYSRAWTLFNQCMSDMSLPYCTLQSLPIEPEQILVYISYLHLLGRSPATITTYTSAIGYVHKINSHTDPTSNYLVQKTLATINRIYGSSDSRLPITQMVLQQLLFAIDNTISIQYHRYLLKAMFITAFYGLFRIGELTIQKSGVVSLMFEDIQINSNSIKLSIRNFKNNTSNHTFDIEIFRQIGTKHCPYDILKDYLSLRGNSPGPLFCLPDLSHVSRSFFTKHLKQCLQFSGFDPRLYLSHSFRIGGASYLASIGCTDLQIKILGRWKSDSFIRYIRGQKYNIRV